jgi:hypothetical protein
VKRKWPAELSPHAALIHRDEHFFITMDNHTQRFVRDNDSSLHSQNSHRSQKL